MPDKLGPSAKMREKLLDKYFFFSGNRRDQIKQFFHPEEDVFPKTDKRPTSLTKTNDYEWRSQKDKYPSNVGLPAGIRGVDIKDIEFPHKFSNTLPTLGMNSGKGLMGNHFLDIGTRLGLGTATRSLGLDETGNPYLSVYDAWDFEDPADKYLTKGGTPFNVYDRFPINMKNGKFPDQVYTGPGEDINLPAEKGIGPSKKVKK